MEVSYCELRRKEVVNIYDGRSLGHIIDIIIDTRCARVVGIVVPRDRGLFNVFKSSDFFIPYNRICRIGKDIILVELNYCQPKGTSTAGILEQKQPKDTCSPIDSFSLNDDYYENIFDNYNSPPPKNNR